MKVLFYLLGGIILAYYGISMNTQRGNRPRWILEKGNLILSIGIALMVLGFIF